MKRAIVVGSGAGGAIAARELQGVFSVTVLERGGAFRPLGLKIETAERLKRAGLLFDERSISFLFPAMRVERTGGSMIFVRGIGTGGTTPLSTANARRMGHGLKAIGIDLENEFAELEREIPISTSHQTRWRESTRHVAEICRDLGLGPEPIPKMADPEKCTSCGRCILGCPGGAKWDARRFLDTAKDAGAEVLTGWTVERVHMEGRKALGVYARRKRGRRRFFPADLVILSAGGAGTPVILENSGIPCEPRLFVDPVLCVAGEWPGALQNREIPMPFAVDRDSLLISPYFDFLSYFFNRSWKPAAGNIMSLMIKLADETEGTVTRRGMQKALTATDRRRLEAGVALCREILGRAGIPRENIFLGTVNAGHPGGMLPLGPEDARSLHSRRLPGNVFIADPTVFPDSLGNPPILTIMALAKRVSKAAAESLA